MGVDFGEVETIDLSMSENLALLTADNYVMIKA